MLVFCFARKFASLRTGSGAITAAMAANKMETDSPSGGDASTSGTKKVEIDYDKIKADIAAAKSVASKGKVLEAVETLLNIEKQQRLAEDVTSTKMACSAILEVLFEAREYQQLNEHVILLSKRRSQLKQAVQAFVRQAMGYIDQLPDKEKKVELIKALQTVTEGKIYVEIERARLTKRLAIMKEEEGNIQEAADILQEVAVETFGAMAKTEKVHYILEQVRLCLDRKDFARGQILLRKVSPRAFVDVNKKGTNVGEIGIEGSMIEPPAEGTPDIMELKIRYYKLSIVYHAHNSNYLEMCRCYRAIYETPSIAEDPEKWTPVLKKICWLVVLAPTDSDQVTLLQLTQADKKLSQLPLYKELLTTFSTKELVWYRTLEEKYREEMAAETEVFAGEYGKQAIENFKLRIIEHNVLVVSKYYSNVRMARLAELLDLPADETEKHLADMVVSKALTAKIDRPAGIVRFALRKQPEDVLNGWANNISKLLDLVEKSCQQIQKESMVHKVPIGAS